MSVITTQIVKIKPGDIIYQIHPFIVLNNTYLPNFSPLSYKLTILNSWSHVIEIICAYDQYYDLLVV